MNLSDFFGARWLSLEVPFERFEAVRIRCRSCYQILRDHGDYQVLSADRSELIRLGARVVYFPPYRSGARERWVLVLPLTAVNLERVAYHLFHELEHEWDHAFVGSQPVRVVEEDDWDPHWGKKPVSVDDLAEGKIATLPLPAYGNLPRSWKVAPP